MVTKMEIIGIAAVLLVLAVLIVNPSWTLANVADSGITVNEGQTFSYTLTVSNTKGVSLPDTDHTDGTRSWLYTSIMVFSPSGTEMIPVDVDEVVGLDSGASIPMSIVYAVPETPEFGRYTATAILFEYKKVWNPSANSWEYVEIEEIDKQAVSFNVKSSIPAPGTPDPSNIISQITEFFKNVWLWILGLFGL